MDVKGKRKVSDRLAMGGIWLLRIIAITRPTRNDRAIDTTESFIVTYSPESIQSKCFPEVTIAQSNR